ncbi:hypothetical protein PTMSG1_09637 [Pyrenophora teres f. maculata]|nr:hypothetical protein PTMSG1_09637 [Pyrenophora teres f. maculata]
MSETNRFPRRLLSTTTVLLFGPLLALAKDCAVYYSYSTDDNRWNAPRDAHAVSMCKDIGSTEQVVGIFNERTPFWCTICKGARDSTKDYERDVYQDVAKELVKYTVRCGTFAPGKCHDK